MATLGQMAFEAARAAGPVSFVEWDEQSPEYQRGWEVAAQAVADYAVKQFIRTGEHQLADMVLTP